MTKASNFFSADADELASFSDADLLKSIGWERGADPGLVAAAARGDVTAFAEACQKRLRESRTQPADYAAAALILVYVSTRSLLALLLLGPLVAFFATGYFSGFGAVTAEIYPTAIRATAQGLTYNIGRVASAVAPFAVGTLAQTQGFGVALSTCSVAFVLAALCWGWIPETRGRTMA